MTSEKLPNSNQGKNLHWSEKGLNYIKEYWLFAGLLTGLFVATSIFPFLFFAVKLPASVYYGSLFFTVLFGSSITLLMHSVPPNGNEREYRDYRVIHFTLRLAFVFGLGAVLIAILLLIFLIGSLPNLRQPF